MCSARVTIEARASGEVRVRLRAHEGESAKRGTPLSTITTNFKKPRYNCMKSGYGALPTEPRRYTVYARRMTREACAVLEEKYAENCWFITLTLPGSTRAAISDFARWSSYVMARVRQWFRDNFPQSEVIAVWELQRRGALHMHMACGGVGEIEMEALKKRVHAMWCSLLEQLSYRGNFDLFDRGDDRTWRHQWHVVQTKVEKVTKSVTRYLSKYLSKAKTSLWTQESYSPTRWWSCSRSLLEGLRRARLTLLCTTASYQDATALFEAVAGTISGVAQATFAIANQYKPGDRCLSAWMLSGQIGKMLAYKAWIQLPEGKQACYAAIAERCTAPPSLSHVGGRLPSPAECFLPFDKTQRERHGACRPLCNLLVPEG